MLLSMAGTTKILTSKVIEKKLKSLSQWQINKKGTELSRVFDTHTFLAGLALTAKIAVHAEILNHHPDVELSYGQVKVKLSTHDVEGLTNLDFELAKKIDGVQS
jgi:4a-hydroxytetrahydrobiopterin dehydratase